MSGGVPDGPIYMFPLNQATQVFEKITYLQEEPVPPRPQVWYLTNVTNVKMQ